MSLFNVRKQLTFYGAYHSNPINVFIHVICVPIIQWSAWSMVSNVSTRGLLPTVHYDINRYLVFDLNFSTVHALISIIFYLLLEPTAAFLYAPQGAFMLLSATAVAQNFPELFKYVLGAHIVSWILQFIGHGAAEKRAPALFDNLLQALFLAPFFVHLEILFHFFNYNQQLQQHLKNDVGVEIARIRKLEGDKKRAGKK
ncbi:hypothetical protein BXZ70DRAFT_918993 [Cristinia sonorae]|uniref:DUF962 domain-containing protein n=1 Tax=Cristinia sonorae TaxID=1940300 RepID=A0A8K0UXU4_9AGAR|nr:hypothetical protein BXZ70DRAFT_918993 [Cristinia sonorae]